MANKTLAENVAQVKADFKSIRDGFGEYFDSIYGEPTSAYGNYPFYTYNRGKGEGITQGKQEVISNSKYIPKTASGKVIRLDDVSEVYHNVVVKADTPTEVKVYGKNLFNNDTSLLKEITYTNTSGTQSTRIGYELDLPEGRYTFSVAKSDSAFDGYIYGLVQNKDGGMVKSFHLTEGKTLISPVAFSIKDSDKLIVYNGVAGSVASAIAMFEKVNIQLSAYSQGGDFEEYQCQTIIATPNGTEIPSNCPTMTFLADNDIIVDYYVSYSKHEFWTKYLSKQKASGLYSGFAGSAWTDLTFDPPVDIETNSSSNMFSYSFVEDLRGILAKNNAKIIFMNTSGSQHYNVFANSRVKYCPYLKLSETATCYGFFTKCSRLIEVDGYECTEKHTFEISSGANKTFQGCTNLVHIIFHGVIANTINMQDCKKLDLESGISLLEHLYNYHADDATGTPFAKTVTLPPEVWSLLDPYYNDNAREYALGKGWNVA